MDKGLGFGCLGFGYASPGLSISHVESSFPVVFGTYAWKFALERCSSFVPKPSNGMLCLSASDYNSSILCPEILF